MLRAILNESWRQHTTKQLVYGHLPPITKTIKVKQTRHAGQCWRSRDEHIRCTPMDPVTWPSKSEATSSNLDTAALCRYGGVALRTCRKRWTIRRVGERGSGVSVLIAWQDDDDFFKTSCLPEDRKHQTFRNNYFPDLCIIRLVLFDYLKIFFGGDITSHINIALKIF